MNTNDPDSRRAILSEAIVRLGEGDDSALQEVYRLTSAKLFGICLRICGERGGAEDVLHEVYCNVWKRAGAYQPGLASPISWLAIIARNRSIDWLREQRGRPTLTIDHADRVASSIPDQSMELERANDAATLRRCLAKLDIQTRDIILRAFFDGFSYPELAEQLAIPLSTLKSRVRRGLSRLRACLEAE